MTAVALCFPGQGSQAPGMADGLMDLPAAAPLLAAAEGAGLDLAAALAGDAEALRATNMAQPALLFVELVLAAELTGLDIRAVAGHSVGEYAALVVAGALDAAAAMRLVVARGRAMAAMREGGMAALLGAGDADVAALCQAVQEQGEVLVVANHNAPGQLVVSGSSAGIALALELASAHGVRRAVRLNVSGAFHSPLMREAAQHFGHALDRTALADAALPVVCNVDAQAVTEAAGLRARLERQLVSPVLWSASVQRLEQLGVRLLVEVGPQAVLTGLARRIAPELATTSVSSPAAARELGARLGAVARG